MVTDVPEVLGDLVVAWVLVSSGICFQRAGDLRDVLVGVLAADGVDVAGQAVVVFGVAEEEVDVVEQLGALEEPLVLR